MRPTYLPLHAHAPLVAAILARHAAHLFAAHPRLAVGDRNEGSRSVGGPSGLRHGPWARMR